MPKKKIASTKKTSKTATPRKKKVRRVIENPAKTLTDGLARLGGDIEPMPGEVTPIYSKEPPLAPTDVYHKAQAEEAKAAEEEAAQAAKELALAVDAKIIAAAKQAHKFLEEEFEAAFHKMQFEADAKGREFDLLAAQEPGYMAYVLTAEVARTVNRVRPDIRCEDLLALVKELPR